jgi:hypothetical protein
MLVRIEPARITSPVLYTLRDSFAILQPARLFSADVALSHRL